MASAVAVCRSCQQSRLTPSAGKVGCMLLTRMEGTPGFIGIAKTLRAVWHGKMHPDLPPGGTLKSAADLAEGSVLVGADDHCQHFKAR